MLLQCFPFRTPRCKLGPCLWFERHAKIVSGAAAPGNASLGTHRGYTQTLVHLRRSEQRAIRDLAHV